MSRHTNVCWVDGCVLMLLSGTHRMTRHACRQPRFSPAIIRIIYNTRYCLPPAYPIDCCPCFLLKFLLTTARLHRNTTELIRQPLRAFMHACCIPSHAVGPEPSVSGGFASTACSLAKTRRSRHCRPFQRLVAFAAESSSDSGYDPTVIQATDAYTKGALKVTMRGTRSHEVG